MATLAELAALRTDLGPDRLEHLQRFLGSWSLLADLAFSDLLLVLPLEGTDPLADDPEGAYVVLGQIRPNNGPTLVVRDLLGETLRRSDFPQLRNLTPGGERSSVRRFALTGSLLLEIVPLRFHDELLALVLRIQSAATDASPYEQLYTDAYERLCRMVSEGAFPFAEADVYVEGSPRVGDGTIGVDEELRVEFASPNAITALHRIGVFSPPEGRSLLDLGADLHPVERSIAAAEPVVFEIERLPDVVVRIQSIPLIAAGEVTGAIVLLRDVTDVRRLGRIVLSKDTAIREVHHRVKNNLQTISSLLSLQARRVHGIEGRLALLEAERRVRSIALVHEVLSREPGDQVPFDDIVESLVEMARDSVITQQPVEVTVEGDLGEVGAEVATPLALALAELLQNAVEHGFARPDAAEEVDGEWVIRHEDLAGHVHVALAHDAATLRVEITDDGRGLPEEFSIATTTSLGLSIVRDLIESQLGGELEMRRIPDAEGGGTLARFEVPVGERWT